MDFILSMDEKKLIQVIDFFRTNDGFSSLICTFAPNTTLLHFMRKIYCLLLACLMGGMLLKAQSVERTVEERLTSYFKEYIPSSAFATTSPASYSKERNAIGA